MCYKVNPSPWFCHVTSQKAVPGEVTEAEANGETEKPAADTETGGENKPKKKKKKSTFVSAFITLIFLYMYRVVF